MLKMYFFANFSYTEKKLKIWHFKKILEMESIDGSLETFFSGIDDFCGSTAL